MLYGLLTVLLVAPGAGGRACAPVAQPVLQHGATVPHARVLPGPLYGAGGERVAPVREPQVRNYLN